MMVCEVVHDFAWCHLNHIKYLKGRESLVAPLKKLLLAAAGSIFITLTFSTLSASAAEDSTEVLKTTTLNRFVVSDGGN
ncbi:MAG: hypothetical protein LIO74_02855 [Ruminococcus sp.]|nr:hypothetical protein [Ruminococcus sp.]